MDTTAGRGLTRNLPIEGEKWGKLCYNSVEIGRAVNICQPSTSRKAKTLWKGVTKAKGEAHHDQGSERQIESRVTVRHALWKAHLQSPMSALAEASDEQKRKSRVLHHGRKHSLNVHCVSIQPFRARSFCVKFSSVRLGVSLLL